MSKIYAPSTPVEIYKASQKQNKQYYSIVKKSNLAIRKARYSLSLQQQKILCYLISELKETDTHETQKKFDIKGFFDFMDIECKSYERVRDNLKALRDKSWFVQKEDGWETTVSFLSKVSADKQSGNVIVTFDKDMLPFLQNLKAEYTQYKLWYTLTMRSEYSLRLYELLKSVANKETWYFELAELKRIFMCENYKKFNDFKKRVIEPAVKEINGKTDINVAYELSKDGRSYVGIEFYISYKSTEDRLNVDRQIRSELDISGEYDGENRK